MKSQPIDYEYNTINSECDLNENPGVLKGRERVLNENEFIGGYENSCLNFVVETRRFEFERRAGEYSKGIPKIALFKSTFSLCTGAVKLIAARREVGCPDLIANSSSKITTRPTIPQGGLSL